MIQRTHATRGHVLTGIRDEVSTAMKVKLNRNSVAAGDDIESHEEIRSVPEGLVVQQVILNVAQSGYLPRGTWSVSSKSPARPIAVIAPPWNEARMFSFWQDDLLYWNDTLCLEFKYHPTEEPEDVFSQLKDSHG